MRHYMDASAAAKLLLGEAESAAMVDYLSDLSDEDEVISSLLLETELRRVAVREDLPQVDVTELLSGITLVHPERDFFKTAGFLSGRTLRSLDALHLTTALKADAHRFVAYDRRLRDAAVAAGFVVVSPA